MRRFFVEKLSNPAFLSPEESRHITRALRLGPGDRITIFDSREAWTGEIESTDGRVRVKLLERLPQAAFPRVVVAAAVPKGARLDWMIEKLAELGAAEFVPVRFARSVADWSESKRRRLEKIAIAAAKQSGAPILRIAEERSVQQIPDDALLADPEASTPLPAGPATLVIGPEGGLTPEERGRFAKRFSLGPTVLRVETAALAAAARALT